MKEFEAELHAIALGTYPNYRVVRKLDRRSMYDWPLPEDAKIGLLVDVETTGLDPWNDEIIELGMLRFAYTSAGTILGPLADFQGLREPKKPIPKRVTQLTGITNEMVSGHRIDESALADFVSSADIIVAHNARFDRQFCERLNSIFMHKAWACSQEQIPWYAEGVEGTKLFYIAYQQAFWFEGHRALDDCYALLELLEMPLPMSHEMTFRKLLEEANRPTMRVWAIGAPYEVKDRLRERGYRWNAGQDGRYRSWYREVDPEQVDAELRFLEDINASEIATIVTQIDANLRFSDRLF